MSKGIDLDFYIIVEHSVRTASLSQAFIYLEYSQLTCNISDTNLESHTITFEATVRQDQKLHN